ncbi:hypothetical protein EVAR_43382_1 [Eumeta japonica]|uniref:C-type lectin domain-containing protein n=1 Tax=Eumeta variegata TaxID=151549 RepID=A0A4C1WNN4_EUMVA|nr:hypothetical protein EVAR_43382_1 [Eumeta japonica]
MYELTGVRMCADWHAGWVGAGAGAQPNDDGLSAQDCVEVRRAFPPRPPAPSFFWNDRGCKEHNYYVCQKPIAQRNSNGAGLWIVEENFDFVKFAEGDGDACAVVYRNDGLFVSPSNDDVYSSNNLRTHLRS